LYLSERKMPMLWLLVSAVIGVLALATCALFFARSAPEADPPPPLAARLRAAIARLDSHFFLLGAAFLLVETHTITRAGLFYGTTWRVSSVTIGALLVMILVANWIVSSRPPKRAWFVYAGLVGSLALGLLFSRSSLLALHGAPRLAAVGVLFTLPILFAGIIFARSFKAARDVSGALGSNLLGAVIGGLAESVSFAVGLRGTVAVAMGLYLLSGWALARGGGWGARAT
jgi:hypothetical protein